MSCDCACELCIGHKGGHSEWQLSDQIYTDSRSGSRFIFLGFGADASWGMAHAHAHRHRSEHGS